MRLSPKTLSPIELTSFIESVYTRLLKLPDSNVNPIQFIADFAKEKSESEADFFKFSLALCNTVEQLRSSNYYISVFSHFLDGAYGTQSLLLLKQLTKISKELVQLDLLNLARFYSESDQRANMALLTLDQSISMISHLSNIEIQDKDKYLQTLSLLFRRASVIDPFKLLEELLFV